MFRRSFNLIAVSTVLCVSTATFGQPEGPDWPELSCPGGDAGSSPQTACTPSGSGPVARVRGSVTETAAFGPGDDLEDMFLIHIPQPGLFFARTSQLNPPPGHNLFDTQLWLFDLNGYGFRANDNVSFVNTLSYLDATCDDANCPNILPGLYYIAITAYDDDPLSAGGLIFDDQSPPTQISGPDGPGGGQPLANWSGNSFLPLGVHQYEIELQGAEFVTGNEVVALWDTGPPNQVIFNGNATFLGYLSGDVLAAGPQRWAAVPFRVSHPDGWRVTQIDVDWFIAAGTDADNVLFRIWKWNAGGRDVPPDQFDLVAQGVLGPYAAGVDDPRVPGTEDWLHQYPVDFELDAGKYYLTVYADGGPPDNAIAWLTGAVQIEQVDIERCWMWRSASFPIPGFTAYAPGCSPPPPACDLSGCQVLPNAGQDPDDRWNPAFTIWGTIRLPCPCPGDVNGSNTVDGDDMDCYVQCVLYSPDANCGCNCASLTPAAFAAKLLQAHPNCP